MRRHSAYIRMGCQWTEAFGPVQQYNRDVYKRQDVYGMQTGASLKEFRDFETELGAYAKEQYGEDWSSDYKEFAMDLLNGNGEYYALPLGLNYAGFVWADRALMNQYDVDIPHTYDELVTAAGILRKNDQYPIATGAKDDWINIDTWMSIANDINPEKLYSAIEGETSFEDEDLVHSFEIWQNCFKDGVFQDEMCIRDRSKRVCFGCVYFSHCWEWC